MGRKAIGAKHKSVYASQLRLRMLITLSSRLAGKRFFMPRGLGYVSSRLFSDLSCAQRIRMAAWRLWGAGF